MHNLYPLPSQGLSGCSLGPGSRSNQWPDSAPAVSAVQASAATHPQGGAGPRSGNKVKTWSGCTSLACAAQSGEIRRVGKGGGGRGEVGVAH